MKLKFYWLDVFAAQRFGGNPLAVVFQGEALSQEDMQKIAFEFHLSETTFILPPTDPQAHCQVRIFTPWAEIPFAGHPTLGSAYAVKKEWQIDDPQLLLEEAVGLVPVKAISDQHFQFSPAVQPTYQDLPVSVDSLSEFMGLNPADIDLSFGPPQIVSCGVPYTLIPIRSLAAIQEARYVWEQDHPQLIQHPALREVYLFTRETQNPQLDFHVRMFAPAVGIPEDPATGSAAATLGAWLLKFQDPFATQITLEQGLEIQRPSVLGVSLEAGQIAVQGQVLEVMCGEIDLS